MYIEHISIGESEILDGYLNVISFLLVSRIMSTLYTRNNILACYTTLLVFCKYFSQIDGRNTI